jgi:hypothetical protein
MMLEKIGYRNDHDPCRRAAFFTASIVKPPTISSPLAR